jgi:polygalacturonase
MLHARHAVSLVLLALCSCSASDDNEPIATQRDAIRRPKRDAGAPSIVISSALALSAGTVTPGGTLTGTVTYRNDGSSSGTIAQINIAVRPPGGTNSGGPFADMAPTQGSVTLAPGESVTLQASRTFSASEEAGTWYAYSTYEDTSGTWHDAAPIHFDVSAASTGVTCATVTGASATANFAPAGATPNDATDDLPAIQNAVDSASLAGGGVVSLAAGTFVLNGHLVMKSNVKLTGVGPATILQAGPGFMSTNGPNGGYPLITTNGAVNTTIANLTADQRGHILDGNVGSRLVAYLVDVRQSRNALVDGVYTRNPFTYSIAVVESSNFCVQNSNTRVETSGRYDQLDGIHILDSWDGHVSKNYVDQRYNGSTDGDDGLVAHTIRGLTHDLIYSNNVVRGGSRGNGMQLADGNYSIYGLTIENNEFWGSPEGVRTGYYDEGIGVVHDIIVRGNDIHDLVPGIAFPNGGNAIDFWAASHDGKSSGSSPHHITVANNRVCNAGLIRVVAGAGNVVSGTTGC